MGKCSGLRQPDLGLNWGHHSTILSLSFPVCKMGAMDQELRDPHYLPMGSSCVKYLREVSVAPWVCRDYGWKMFPGHCLQEK